MGPNRKSAINSRFIERIKSIVTFCMKVLSNGFLLPLKTIWGKLKIKQEFYDPIFRLIDSMFQWLHKNKKTKKKNRFLFFIRIKVSRFSILEEEKGRQGRYNSRLTKSWAVRASQAALIQHLIFHIAIDWRLRLTFSGSFFSLSYTFCLVVEFTVFQNRRQCKNNNIFFFASFAYYDQINYKKVPHKHFSKKKFYPVSVALFLIRNTNNF